MPREICGRENRRHRFTATSNEVAATDVDLGEAQRGNLLAGSGYPRRSARTVRRRLPAKPPAGVWTLHGNRFEVAV